MNWSGVARPKLLFLSQTLPFPPDGGVKIRTFNILRLLARSFDITALCFYRWKPGLMQPDVPLAVEQLGRYASIEAFPIPQEHDRKRLLWDHVRSMARNRAYTVYSYESHDFRNRLERILRSARFDLVHADSLDLSGYFPMLGNLPIVCTHHDATSVQLRRRGAVEANRIQSLYIQRQADLMEREERYWCERIALNVTVSKEDARVLSEIAPRGRFCVVPNGVDTEFFRPESGNPSGVVCVGGTSWFPNRDALEYFATEILPIVQRIGCQPNVTWVGRARQDEIERYRTRHGIGLTGYVPDVRPYVRDAACYVVPIRTGGGTRIKILDAWAMGKAVVSTSVGCEGLDAQEGKNLLIRDEPEAFAEAVRDVLLDADLRNRLGRSGRATVESSYSWDVIGVSLSQTYRSTLAKPAAPDTTSA
jgi:polysaccharide biosynthesis protein PslH